MWKKILVEIITFFLRPKIDQCYIILGWGQSPKFLWGPFFSLPNIIKINLKKKFLEKNRFFRTLMTLFWLHVNFHLKIGENTNYAHYYWLSIWFMTSEPVFLAMKSYQGILSTVFLAGLPDSAGRVANFADFTQFLATFSRYHTLNCKYSFWDQLGV